MSNDSIEFHGPIPSQASHSVIFNDDTRKVEVYAHFPFPDKKFRLKVSERPYSPIEMQLWYERQNPFAFRNSFDNEVYDDIQ